MPSAVSATNTASAPLSVLANISGPISTSPYEASCHSANSRKAASVSSGRAGLIVKSATLDRQSAGAPLAPGAGVELRLHPGLLESKDGDCRRDPGAAVDRKLGIGIGIGRGGLTVERHVDRTGDVAGDRVDRLDLAAVALGHPSVDEHEAGLSQLRLDLVGRHDVVLPRAHG